VVATVVLVEPVGVVDLEPPLSSVVEPEGVVDLEPPLSSVLATVGVITVMVVLMPP
jgi:hypothetical protein